MSLRRDTIIQALLAEINAEDPALSALTGKYHKDRAAALKAANFDRALSPGAASSMSGWTNWCSTY